MIDPRLLTRMSSFSYFKWVIKNTQPVGRSVGYGYNRRTGWIRRELIIISSNKHTINDQPVPTSTVPAKIREAHYQKLMR